MLVICGVYFTDFLISAVICSAVTLLPFLFSSLSLPSIGLVTLVILVTYVEGRFVVDCVGCYGGTGSDNNGANTGIGSANELSALVLVSAVLVVLKVLITCNGSEACINILLMVLLSLAASVLLTSSFCTLYFFVSVA